MINLQNLLKYTPSQHGEHGVDSIIHRLCKTNAKLHESYCNPPGASWAEIIIQHPSGSLYHWDHIPRAPIQAKRPDSIIQFTKSDEIHLLAIESKEKITDIYPNMTKLLKNFFTGSSKYDGLFNRPAWHKSTDGITPSYIEDIKEQYWIKKYTKKFVYSGFAFSFEPEYYAKISDFNDASWILRLQESLKKSKLDMIIGVGWYGAEHIPFTRIVTSNSFGITDFSKTLTNTLTI